MIEHNETQRAYTGGLSAADEVALYAHMGRLMDQAAAHRHACERLERAYGPTLPQPYKPVYTTHYAKREALDAQIRALGSALYPDEGEESADELDDTAYSRVAALAGEAAHISGVVAMPDEIKRVAAIDDATRIIGYVESDADNAAAWRDEWRGLVVALVLIGLLGAVGTVAGKGAGLWR